MLLCLDIDRFNRINETLGATKGDRLLKAIAQRLTSSVGSDDSVGRIAADQFAIILAPVETKQAAVAVAQNILNSLSIPFLLDSQEVFITASIGISIYPQDARDIDTLLQNAETAIFAARNQGGNQYQFYTPQLQVASSDRLALETSLRYAIEREEFQVYYQPQVNLATGQIIGAEALVRWQNPNRGLISPADFIPLAEETGLIIPLGEWVLRSACIQAQAWSNLGFPPLRIAVNLSSRQFNQSDLSEQLIKILHQTRLDPQWLELELTESMVVQNVEATIARLHEIRSLGIQISIDDFGTGYSSLSYLQKLPFDTLKIDQCFVRQLDNNPKNAALTRAIIDMARSLSLKVIAEGVETLQELAFLCQNRCDAMQGYLFSRPVSADEFQQLIASGKCLQIPSPDIRQERGFS